MIIRLICIYFIYVFIVTIGELTKKKGFEKLKIIREIEKNRVFEGESFTIQTVVENNKWLPVSFLLLKEKMVNTFQYEEGANCVKEGINLFHFSKYSISKYERRKRSYTIKAEKRGTYIIKDIELTIGDIFGFSAESKELIDYKEILVYPRVKKLKDYKFSTINLIGDNIIKRWIYKDPLYIKGIREYNVEDRMKDIHWKASLKMNNLMVKEYDYTSERELVIIVNVQCAEQHWREIQPRPIENAIKIAVSLAAKSLKEGIPTGMWTNAKIVTMASKHTREVKASTTSMNAVMELCARMDRTTEMDFQEYLMKQRYEFSNNCTYVIITPYLNDQSAGILSKLSKAGYDLKLIDVSLRSNLPSIKGIEKIAYKGELV